MSYVPRLAEFQSVLPDTLLLLGVDGTILDNHVPPSTDLFSAMEPLNGRHFSMALPASLACSLEQSMELARTHAASVTTEIDTTCNGKQRAYEIRVMSREDDACLAIFRDITLRHREEAMMEHIARQRRELAAAERATLIARTTAAMSHEIGQPLTAILANADAATKLLAHPVPDLRELRQINAEIVACAERATSMFDRLRELLGRRSTHATDVDINRVVEDVVLMSNAELMMRQVLVHTNLGSHLPKVFGSREQLQQVILNLLMNAADAVGGRDRPAIVITTSLVESSIAVDVSDNGEGIARHHFPRLFEPFFSTRPRGMGMGLAICWDVVHNHGGTIEALNNAGGGAVFRVLLPASSPVQRSTRAYPPGWRAPDPVLGIAVPGEASNDPAGFEIEPDTTADTIHRSRQVRLDAITVNLQAAINQLRLARKLKDAEVSRRSLRIALVILHSNHRLTQKLVLPPRDLRELTLMRAQILELMAELE